MGRKSFAGLIVLAFLLTAAGGFAAEKVDNVFIAGLDAGYCGYTGWMGENFQPNVGGALFFGYAITPNFAIELDYIPLLAAETAEDADDSQYYQRAYWGGIGQDAGGFGGLGLSGKLYPRNRFRDADFVLVQPYYRMGLGWLPFMWEYEWWTKTPPREVPLYENEDWDGFNSIYLNVGGGVDFMLAKWVSLGVDLRLWSFFVMGDTINGYAADDYFFKSDFESSYMYSAGLNATFQW